jgi:hypothetical protein
MIWLQALACFVVWTAYGLWLRRSSENLRARMQSMGRGTRASLGSVGLLAGLAVLGAGLWAVSALGGLTAAGLTAWAWLAVTVVGIGFVHLQVLGAAALVTLVLDEETARTRRASVSLEKEPQ